MELSWTSSCGKINLILVSSKVKDVLRISENFKEYCCRFIEVMVLILSHLTIWL